LFKIVDVSSIVVDAFSFEDNQDTLYAPAGQVYKVLMQGVSLDKTNCALQLFSDDPSEKQGDLNKKGSSYSGNVSGALIGTAGYTNAEQTQNIPLWIDDTVGLRLETASSMSSSMCIVVYMRVE
jgi:hypothetical protein